MLRFSALAMTGVLAAGLLVTPAQARDDDHRRGDGVRHGDNHRGDRNHRRRGSKIVIGVGDNGIYIDKRKWRHHERRHNRY